MSVETVFGVVTGIARSPLPWRGLRPCLQHRAGSSCRLWGGRSDHGSVYGGGGETEASRGWVSLPGPQEPGSQILVWPRAVVPEEEDKKEDHEKILEEIIAENFRKLEKEVITQVQETQRVPNRISPR